MTAYAAKAALYTRTLGSVAPPRGGPSPRTRRQDRHVPPRLRRKGRARRRALSFPRADGTPCVRWLSSRRRVGSRRSCRVGPPPGTDARAHLRRRLSRRRRKRTPRACRLRLPRDGLRRERGDRRAAKIRLVQGAAARSGVGRGSRPRSRRDARVRGAHGDAPEPLRARRRGGAGRDLGVEERARGAPGAPCDRLRVSGGPLRRARTPSCRRRWLSPRRVLRARRQRTERLHPLALRRRQIDARDSLLDFRAKIEGGHDKPLPLRALYRRRRYGMEPQVASCAS